MYCKFQASKQLNIPLFGNTHDLFFCLDTLTRKKRGMVELGFNSKALFFPLDILVLQCCIINKAKFQNKSMYHHVGTLFFLPFFSQKCLNCFCQSLSSTVAQRDVTVVCHNFFPLIVYYLNTLTFEKNLID